MKRAMWMLLLGGLVTFAMGFQCGGPPTPPPVGFQIHTMDEDNLFGTLQDSPSISVVGNLQEAIVSNPVGVYTYFSATTDGNGYAQALNAVVPANWLFSEYNGPCGNQSTVATVGDQQTQDLDCIGTALGFILTPGTLYVSSPPAHLSITGSGILTTYGMPHVQIFNSVGAKVADVVATSVTNNGQALTSPTPSLAGLTTGTYGLEVLNVQSNGSLAPVGATPVPVVAPWNGGGGGGGGGGHCGHECT
jgi:hypothetical protein